MRGPRPTLEREIAFWRAGGGVVAGVDEAGRGPLAGPVVAAAVVFPPLIKPIRGLRDSKMLPPAKRARLALVVRARALAIGVGAASVREIDRLNIRRASILAMRRALARLGLEPALVLVDGLPCPELGRPHDAIVDGDACCHSIAAASVIAKTVRDRLMELLGARHPLYAWGSNKGYGTPDHLAALAAFGFTSHHRKSFAPVVQLELAVEDGRGRERTSTALYRLLPPFLVPSETPPRAAYSECPPPRVPPAAPGPPRTS